MNIIQNKTLGFYLPNFFRLHIDTKNSIENLNTLSDLDFSIFLHEYIHFLQNITTYYGLENIYKTVDYMKYANNKIISDKLLSFNVPIKPDNNIELNCYLSSITYGDVGDENTTINNITKYTTSKEKIPIQNSFIDEIESVLVEFKDNKNEDNCFTFGAGCIMESMAYLIETLTFNKNEYAESPNLPYETATMLAEYIYPQFAENKLNILALCDISLNSFNPAVSFVKVIEDWKIRNSIPKYPLDLYKEFQNLNPTFSQCIDSLSSIVKKQMQDYFNDSYFGSITNWANYIVDSAIKLREKYPTFILDIAVKPIKQNDSLCKIFKYIGTPLLTNDSGFHGFYSPCQNANIGYFWAISQIYKILYIGEFSQCELVDCCKQSLQNTVDCRCKKSPWKKCSDKYLCPFAVFWKHWGLADFEPIFR